MSLVRFEPWSLVDRNSRDNHRTWVPAVDIFEEKDRFVVRADLPGVDPNEIDVNMENGMLTVSGERKNEERSEFEGVSRVERISGRFLRRFTLPESADSDAIEAKYRNGILDITIPKQAVVQPRRITVEAA